MLRLGPGHSPEWKAPCQRLAGGALIEKMERERKGAPALTSLLTQVLCSWQAGL